MNVNKNWIQESEYITDEVEFLGDFSDKNSPPDTMFEEIDLVSEINDQKPNYNYQATKNNQKNLDQQDDHFKHTIQPQDEINKFLNLQNTNEHEVSTLKKSLLLKQELHEKKLEIRALQKENKILEQK